jgi:hypothetical protein
MTGSGRTSPYAAAPGFGNPLTLNGKLLLKPGYSGLVPNKYWLKDWNRPTIAVKSKSLEGNYVLNPGPAHAGIFVDCLQDKSLWNGVSILVR